MMTNRIFVLLGLLIACAPAQEVTISTEILTIAIDEPVSGLFYHNGSEICNLQANLTGLGEPLVYKGPRLFELRASPAEFSVPAPLPKPTAWVELPVNSDRVLLICIKSAAAPVKLVAYDIGKARITAGDYRFFNFSHSAVSAIFGEKKFSVSPGADTLLSNEAWKTDVAEIDIKLAVITDGKAKPVYSSVWGHRPGRRNYVFFFDGQQTYKPVKICRFFDVPSKDPEGRQAP